MMVRMTEDGGDDVKQNLSSKYGPENCISTYLSSAGTCVMETKDCSDEAISATNFGFLCLNDDDDEGKKNSNGGGGGGERHFYGTNSFKAFEKMDTGIQCSQCLGADVSIMPKGGVESIKQNKVDFIHAKIVLVEKSLTKMSQEMKAMVEKVDKAQKVKAKFLAEKKRKSVVLDVHPPKILFDDNVNNNDNDNDNDDNMDTNNNIGINKNDWFLFF